MGNWRTVNITGTMSAADSAKLLGLLNYGSYADEERYRHVWDAPYACLSFSLTSPGLCGLGEWPRGPEDIDGTVHVSRCGNLAERDYGVQDVAIALEALVREAPSMLLKVHCGGEWESEECVATISVGEGLVVTGGPEMEKVDGPSEAQIHVNFLRNLMR